jgi:hypothetical protein
MKFNLPTGVTIALSAAFGVLVAFVGSGIIVLEPEWAHYVEVGGTILALFGISPLTGASFRAILHLSQTASAVIAASLGGLVVILQQVHMSAGLHGVLAGLIVFAAGLGFAPSPTTP